MAFVAVAPRTRVSLNRDIRNSSLVSAALVCRRWLAPAYEQLYSDCRIIWDGRSSKSFSRTLKTYNDLSWCVQRITVELMTEELWLEEYFDSDEYEDGLADAEERWPPTEDGFRTVEDDEEWMFYLESREEEARMYSDPLGYLADADFAEGEFWMLASTLPSVCHIDLTRFSCPPPSFHAVRQLLRRLKSAQINSPTSLTHPFLPHFRSITTLIIDGDSDPPGPYLYRAVNLPTLRRLRLRRAPRTAFELIVGLNLEKLEALDYEENGLEARTALANYLHEMVALCSLSIGFETRRWSDKPSFIFLNHGTFTQRLKYTFIKHLRVATWPSDSIIAALPPTIESLDLPCHDRAPSEAILGACWWKANGLPALNVVRLRGMETDFADLVIDAKGVDADGIQIGGEEFGTGVMREGQWWKG